MCCSLLLCVHVAGWGGGGGLGAQLAMEEEERTRDRRNAEAAVARLAEYEACIKAGKKWVPKDKPPTPRGLSLADLVAAEAAEDEAVRGVAWAWRGGERDIALTCRTLPMSVACYVVWFTTAALRPQKNQAKRKGDALGDVVAVDLQEPASVKHLSLSGCHALTDKGVEELASRCRNLTHLNISVGAHHHPIASSCVMAWLWCDALLTFALHGPPCLGSLPPPLLSLGLSARQGMNMLTNEGLVSISKYCTKLETLSVAGKLNFNSDNIYNQARRKLKVATKKLNKDKKPFVAY